MNRKLITPSILTALFAVITFFWTSCGEPPYAGDITVTEVNMVGTLEKTVAKLEIDGMMCEVGCVAKVKKELLEQEGVSNVIIDFEKGRKSNFAIVEYDPSTKDALSLSSTITDIADGKLYGVRAVEVTNYAPASSTLAE